MTDQQLLARISIDPRVMGGNPVIAGTRLTVAYVLGLLAEGAGVRVSCLLVEASPETDEAPQRGDGYHEQSLPSPDLVALAEHGDVQRCPGAKDRWIDQAVTPLNPRLPAISPLSPLSASPILSFFHSLILSFSHSPVPHPCNPRFLRNLPPPVD